VSMPGSRSCSVAPARPRACTTSSPSASLVPGAPPRPLFSGRLPVFAEQVLRPCSVSSETTSTLPLLDRRLRRSLPSFNDT
jgi:hypothetical protein